MRARWQAREQPQLDECEPCCTHAWLWRRSSARLALNRSYRVTYTTSSIRSNKSDISPNAARWAAFRHSIRLAHPVNLALTHQMPKGELSRANRGRLGARRSRPAALSGRARGCPTAVPNGAQGRKTVRRPWPSSILHTHGLERVRPRGNAWTRTTLTHAAGRKWRTPALAPRGRQPPSSSRFPATAPGFAAVIACARIPTPRRASVGRCIPRFSPPASSESLHLPLGPTSAAPPHCGPRTPARGRITTPSPASMNSMAGVIVLEGRSTYADLERRSAASLLNPSVASWRNWRSVGSASESAACRSSTLAASTSSGDMCRTRIDKTLMTAIVDSSDIDTQAT